MREVTGCAALGLYGRMFVDKRSGSLYVTLGADSTLIGIRSQHLVFKGAVRIMTIGASHQAFINLVVKGLRERRLGVSVATVAERWFRSFQQIGLDLGRVTAMTTCTIYTGFAMGASFEVRVGARVTG
jgi:hypothetical protein